jgi:hypothetical protein
MNLILYPEVSFLHVTPQMRQRWDLFKFMSCNFLVKQWNKYAFLTPTIIWRLRLVQIVKPKAKANLFLIALA